MRKSTKLAGAFMRSGGFEGADFTRANLQGANVGRARFAGAVFDGADLRAIDLTEANLNGAQADHFTKWPDGFSPQVHGVVIRDTFD